MTHFTETKFQPTNEFNQAQFLLFMVPSISQLFQLLQSGQSLYVILTQDNNWLRNIGKDTTSNHMLKAT